MPPVDPAFPAGRQAYRTGPYAYGPGGAQGLVPGIMQRMQQGQLSADQSMVRSAPVARDNILVPELRPRGDEGM